MGSNMGRVDLREMTSEYRADKYGLRKTRKTQPWITATLCMGCFDRVVQAVHDEFGLELREKVDK
jgi:hypothetical protein